MKMLGDRDYHRVRLQQELAAAEAAAEPHVRRIHEELAGRYAVRLNEAGEAPVPLHLV